MAKKLTVDKDYRLDYEEEELEGGLKDELKRLEKFDFKDLIQQIKAERSLAEAYMRPKFDEWKARLRLYNNQRRDKEAIGDPLLFTVHQTVLASLYSDYLNVTFLPNERGDIDTAENLTMLAKYDYQKMEKDITDYEWIFDSTFFGRGLLLFREFDRQNMIAVPEVLNPLLCLRDPRAKSVAGNRRGRGGARFFGRYMMKTKGEMKKDGVYFNGNSMTGGSTDINDIVMESRSIRAEAQGFGDAEKITKLHGENIEYQLLEWYTIWKNKRVLATIAPDDKTVVRYKEIKPYKGQQYANIPVIDRPVYPMSHDWDGVSIPDLVEDKQRARAVVQNLGLKGVKANMHPMYLFDSTRVDRTYLKFGFNKHVPVNGDPNNAVVPIGRKQLGSEVDYILKVLDVAAQRATATPEQQQGVVSTDKRTLGEIRRVSANVSTRYSLSAKVFGWSEKRFWQQWYMLYKTHFKKDIDTKVVRILGALGVKFRELTKENLELLVDPDITIESSVLAEEDRLRKLQAYQNFLGVALSDPTANKRAGIRQLGKFSNLTRDDVNHILPPTVHELKAEDENEMLEKNQLVEVDVTDDDYVHMEEHNKAADTPAKYAHIQAHKRALMLKLQQPQLDIRQREGAGAQPQEEVMAPVSSGRGQDSSQAAPPAPTPENANV